MPLQIERMVEPLFSILLPPRLTHAMTRSKPRSSLFSQTGDDVQMD